MCSQLMSCLHHCPVACIRNQKLYAALAQGQKLVLQHALPLLRDEEACVCSLLGVATWD